MKLCKRYNIEKPIECFCKQTKSKDGYHSWCKECNKQYKKENKEAIIQYKILNNQKILNKAKQYYIDNKEIHIKRTSENKRKRKKIDPNFMLRGKISSSVSCYITYKRLTKTNPSIIYLGCSIEFYKQYLESQFLPEMTWENHGEIWEIDHIIPISSFDLTIEENIYIAFNYSNTQPLFKTTEIAESLGYIGYIGNRNKFNKLLQTNPYSNTINI